MFYEKAPQSGMRSAGSGIMSTISKRAIMLAVESEYGDRLIEIAQEHARLARRISELHKSGLKDTSALRERIDALRQERDEILVRFENGTEG
jgi:enoyl reductase-like protein